MAFPLEPITGQSHSIGSRTWYWDGATWNLLPANASNDDGSPNHTHDTPKILDDLLDVEVKEPAFSDSYGFYINTSTDALVQVGAPDGWGRYAVNITQRTLTLNKRDLDGKTLLELYAFTTEDVGTTRFIAVDESFDLEAKIVEKSIDTNTITFTYDQASAPALIAINNKGDSKLWRMVNADYKSLSDGAILVYRRNNALWKPEPNPTLETGNKITLSIDPPEYPSSGDVWVDQKNYYMYLWEGDQWIALTGPETGGGGGDIANNSTIKLVSSRGVLFTNDKTTESFTLNQPDSKTIDVIQKNVTTLDFYKPNEGTSITGDIWIDQKTYHSYVFDGEYWIALTGGEKGTSNDFHRLEQPCVVDGGRPYSDYCDDAGNISYIPSPVYIGTEPPGGITAQASPGDLWFDSEHLELRVWYSSGTSHGGWVSTTHPGMRPDLGQDPDPKVLSITGPSVAQQLTESNRYVATISWKVLEEYERAGLTPPKVQWDVAGDPSASQIYKNEDRTIMTLVYTKPGTFTVSASILYYDDLPDGLHLVNQPAENPIRTSVTLKPVGDPIRYIIRVVDGGERGKIFEINGDRTPALNLMRNRKYIFDQSDKSNDGYPMRFYGATEYDADNEIISNDTNGNLDPLSIGGEFTEGVEQIRKEVHFSVPSDSPIRLRYGSPEDPSDNDQIREHMGYWIYPYDIDGKVNLP